MMSKGELAEPGLRRTTGVRERVIPPGVQIPRSPPKGERMFDAGKIVVNVAALWRPEGCLLVVEDTEKDEKVEWTIRLDDVKKRKFHLLWDGALDVKDEKEEDDAGGADTEQDRCFDATDGIDGF